MRLSDMPRHIWRLRVLWLPEEQPALPAPEPQVTVVHVHHYHFAPGAAALGPPPRMAQLPQPRTATTDGKG